MALAGAYPELICISLPDTCLGKLLINCFLDYINWQRCTEAAMGQSYTTARKYRDWWRGVAFSQKYLFSHAENKTILYYRACKTKAVTAERISSLGEREEETVCQSWGWRLMAVWNVSEECEWSERGGHLGYDLIMAPSPLSAFPCPTPWITALRVISRATVRVFGLEIYSSALLVLICGGCLISSLSAAECCSWSVTVQEAPWQAWTALCKPL